MVIYLSGDVDEHIGLDEMTPRQIVAELDKHVVGQHAAKRAVAIALRNRVRRQKLAPDMAADVMPKNIIMIGSTGVGKTEIARRLARLSNSPFLKVEASKFTEVGYVGRDVESMIRDLCEIAVDMVREEKIEEVAEKAENNAEERVLDLLLPQRSSSSFYDFDSETDANEAGGPDRDEQFQKTREKLRAQLREGKLDSRLVEMEVREKSFPTIEVAGPQGVEEMGINMKDMLGNLFQGRTKRQRMRVEEALEYLIQEEEERLVDMDAVARAFHVSKPSDLIPELQGRFPIRVGLDSLTLEDFKRILTEPKNSLVKQYKALLETEGVELEFTEDALDAFARFAVRVNEQTENIGARRLHTIMEKVLDEISFLGPDLEPKRQVIDAAYVTRTLADIVKDQDLSRYVL